MKPLQSSAKSGDRKAHYLSNIHRSLLQLLHREYDALRDPTEESVGPHFQGGQSLAIQLTPRSSMISQAPRTMGLS